MDLVVFIYMEVLIFIDMHLFNSWGLIFFTLHIKLFLSTQPNSLNVLKQQSKETCTIKGKC